MNIDDIFNKVSKAYETAWFLNEKSHDYAGDRISGVTIKKTYDLGRQLVDIVPVKENVWVVVDQPKNFRDYFACGGSSAWGRQGAGNAIKMREFYSCRLLRFVPESGSFFLEREIWKGGRLNKDAAKSEKQFAKFMESMKKDLPPLASEAV